MREQLLPLRVRDVHRLARRAEDDEAADAAAGEVEAVRGLRLEVEGCGGGAVVGGGAGDEEGRDLFGVVSRGIDVVCNTVSEERPGRLLLEARDASLTGT